MKNTYRFFVSSLFLVMIFSFLHLSYIKANTESFCVLKPVIIGSKDYKKFVPIFDKLNHNLKLKPRFVAGLSKEEYSKKFQINYIPYIFIDKKDLSSEIAKVIRDKTDWIEYKEAFVVSKENILKESSIYFLNREKKINNIDIIASGKDIKRYKGDRFIEEFLNSGYRINFHKKGIFTSSDLYEELSVDRLPLILFENQHLVSDFKSLIESEELKKIKDNFKNIELDKKIVIDFFGSPSCKFCNDVKQEVLPEIQKKYKSIVDIIYFNTAEKENYEFLLKMKDYFDIKRGGIPKIFIGNTVLTGRNDISKKLEDEIFNVLVSGRHLFNIKNKIIIEYFFNSYDLENHEDRKEIFYEFLPETLSRYKGQIKIDGYDIKSEENLEKLSKKVKGMDSVQNIKTPIIFIDDNLLQGRQDITDNLDRLIQEKMISLSKGNSIDENVILSQIKRFTLPTVIVAGLLDGINPCAFTVIVFFISFLAVAGYGRRQMFYIGSSFIFAVFLAYFLIGIGLFSVFYKLSFYKIIADIFNKIVIFIVFLLAGFNLYDYIVYKLSKNSKNIVLQLPYKIKVLIHKVIGKGYKTKDGKRKKQSLFRLTFIALIVGFAVSILESICTGQVYFPTVAYLTQLPDFMKIKALIYLFVYNLMFVIPLFLILVLGLLGVKSDDFSRFVKLHLGKIKLLTAILFFFLGYILVILY